MRDPNFVMVWFNCRVIYEQLNNVDEALNCYSKAEELGYEGAARKLKVLKTIRDKI